MLVNLKKITIIIILFLLSNSVNAAFHIWDISEVYSNQDGTVQYVALFCPSNNQQFLAGHDLAATSDGNTVTFTFPGNSGSPTMNKNLLIATSNFAALPGAVTPDFILPDNFINPNATSITVDFGVGQDAITFAGTDLPNDGINSIDDSIVSGINSPTNFAGDMGLLNDPDVVFSNGFE